MIHVMCGVQGSGKTTLSKQLAKEYNAVLYCYDEMPNAHKFNETHSLMFKCIASDLRRHKPVICDDLHTTKSTRMAILKEISGIDCKKILHVMCVPLDECIRRVKERPRGKVPDDVIKKFYNNYEPPTLDEGWDEIIYHNYTEE